MAPATQNREPSHAVKNCPATFVKKSDYQAPYTFNLCGSLRLYRIMLLGLGELSLKLLHDSCGLRFIPNVGQQCSERHSQHQHSQQQTNIRRGTHNRQYSSKLCCCFQGIQTCSENRTNCAFRNSVTMEFRTKIGVHSGFAHR